MSEFDSYYTQHGDEGAPQHPTELLSYARERGWQVCHVVFRQEDGTEASELIVVPRIPCRGDCICSDDFANYWYVETTRFKLIKKDVPGDQPRLHAAVTVIASRAPERRNPTSD
ncbi:MAG: hypothetical protein U0930_22735 [Pirellulales bacterium]